MEHIDIYTGGTSYKENEILDKSINFTKTNRGGKITFHGSGQLVFYFVIDLKKRKINIKNLINFLEKTIAIGIKVKKWIAYHGFSINIDNDLKKYEKIIPCGIEGKKVTNLNEIKKQDYKSIKDILIDKFLINIKN